MRDTPRKHVLVVEDDARIRELVDGVLSDEGYRVSLAEDGAEGLSKCKEDPPHLILLDLIMPNVDGHEFLRRMRSGEGCRAPVVVLSAVIDARQAAEQFKDAGFLAKPFTVADLIASVERHAA
jgi:DNA-binding response OmpR family regulator